MNGDSFFIKLFRGVIFMQAYRFTAFEPTGETLFDEEWQFESDDAAKVQAIPKIEELQVSNKTHRLVNNKGKLIVFHI